jgi:WD40 repeat protein
MYGHRLLLVYAQSGAGKTSLFNAKIAPTLEDQGFQVLPPTRVWGLIPESVDPQAIKNLYVFHALQGLQDVADPGALWDKSLAAFLQGHPRPTSREGRPAPRAIIFDQFEELFSSYPVRWQGQREEFFRQVAEALEDDPLLRVVLVIREDYLAQLDPFARLLPERLRIRFRVERLGKDAARQAIEEPLVKLETGRSFTPEAAEYLVEQLLKVKAFGPDRKVVEVEGPYVEPVQLQVICSRLWDGLLPDETVITVDHIEKFGDVDEALLEFYERAITLVVEGGGAGEGKQATWFERWPTSPIGLSTRLRFAIRERKLRAWFERELITPEGTRGTVFQGQTETSGIPNPLVMALDDVHLIRSEARAGARWYELTHDRFIEPIQESNKRWRDKWTKRLSTLLATTLFALVSIALLTLAQAQTRIKLTRKAEAAATAQAESNTLAQQAITIQKTQPDLALLLSLEATRRSATFPARSGLLTMVQIPATFLHGHQDPIKGMAFSRDDQMLASADSGGTIVLWDMGTGRQHSRLETSGATQVQSLAFSPDGRLLASGGCANPDPAAERCTEGVIRLWDVATGREVEALHGHTHEVSSVAFSPDGRVLASGSCGKVLPGSVSCAQGEIRLWDVLRGEEMAAGRGHTNEVLTLAFSPDSQSLVSCGASGTITLWDLTTRPLVGKPLGGDAGAVNSVAFSPDGQMLAAGGADGAITLWDVATRQLVGDLLSGGAGEVYGIAFSPHGQSLAAGAADGTITLWDVTTREPLGNPLGGHAGAVNSVAFSSDGNTLASGGDDSKAVLWDVGQDSQLGSSLPGSLATVGSVAFSPDGGLLAWGSDNGVIVLWDTQDDHERARFETPGATAVQSVAFSPDGRTLATGADDGTLIVWDVPPPEPTPDQMPHKLILGTGVESPVWSVAFSPDGQMLASSGCREFDPIIGRCTQGEIHLWDVKGQEVATLLGHTTEVWNVAFSPDGRMLASDGCGQFDPEAASCAQGEIRLWDVARGEVIHTLPGPAKKANNLAFSPEGGVLASAGCGQVSPGTGSCSGEILLWDTETGEKLSALGGHEGEVLSLAFSPDGETLASTGLDGTIILWDVPSFQKLGHLLPTGDDVGWPVWSVAFSPDGQELATGNDFGGVTLWDISYRSWQERACRTANRNMTQEEWRLYLGQNVPYECICPNLPSCQEHSADSSGEPQSTSTNDTGSAE